MGYATSAAYSGCCGWAEDRHSRAPGQSGKPAARTHVCGYGGSSAQRESRMRGPYHGGAAHSRLSRNNAIGLVVLARSFCASAFSFGAYRSMADMLAPHSSLCAKISFAITSLPTALPRLRATNRSPRWGCGRSQECNGRKTSGVLSDALYYLDIPATS